MRSRIPTQHRFVLKLIAVGFCLGSAFQLGISTASHFKPRVERVEVHHTVNAKGVAQRFEF